MASMKKFPVKNLLKQSINGLDKLNENEKQALNNKSTSGVKNFPNLSKENFSNKFENTTGNNLINPNNNLNNVNTIYDKNIINYPINEIKYSNSHAKNSNISNITNTLKINLKLDENKNKNDSSLILIANPSSNILSNNKPLFGNINDQTTGTQTKLSNFNLNFSLKNKELFKQTSNKNNNYNLNSNNLSNNMNVLKTSANNYPTGIKNINSSSANVYSATEPEKEPIANELIISNQNIQPEENKHENNNNLKTSNVSNNYSDCLNANILYNLTTANNNPTNTNINSSSNNINSYYYSNLSNNQKLIFNKIKKYSSHNNYISYNNKNLSNTNCNNSNYDNNKNINKNINNVCFSNSKSKGHLNNNLYNNDYYYNTSVINNHNNSFTKSWNNNSSTNNSINNNTKKNINKNTNNQYFNLNLNNSNKKTKNSSILNKYSSNKRLNNSKNKSNNNSINNKINLIKPIKNTNENNGNNIASMNLKRDIIISKKDSSPYLRNNVNIDNANKYSINSFTAKDLIEDFFENLNKFCFLNNEEVFEILNLNKININNIFDNIFKYIITGDKPMENLDIEIKKSLSKYSEIWKKFLFAYEKISVKLNSKNPNYINNIDFSTKNVINHNVSESCILDPLHGKNCYYNLKQELEEQFTKIMKSEINKIKDILDQKEKIIQDLKNEINLKNNYITEIQHTLNNLKSKNIVTSDQKINNNINFEIHNTSSNINHHLNNNDMNNNSLIHHQSLLNSDFSMENIPACVNFNSFNNFNNYNINESNKNLLASQAQHEIFMKNKTVNLKNFNFITGNHSNNNQINNLNNTSDTNNVNNKLNDNSLDDKKYQSQNMIFQNNKLEDNDSFPYSNNDSNVNLSNKNSLSRNVNNNINNNTLLISNFNIQNNRSENNNNNKSNNKENDYGETDEIMLYDQKQFIREKKLLLNENKSLFHKISEMERLLSIQKEKEIKLIKVLFFLNKQGIPIDEIIQNEIVNEKSILVDDNNFNNDAANANVNNNLVPIETSKSMDSLMFLPITLEKPKKVFTKPEVIPVLDLKNINRKFNLEYGSPQKVIKYQTYSTDPNFHINKAEFNSNSYNNTNIKYISNDFSANIYDDKNPNIYKNDNRKFNMTLSVNNIGNFDKHKLIKNKNFINFNKKNFMYNLTNQNLKNNSKNIDQKFNDNVSNITDNKNFLFQNISNIDADTKIENLVLNL